MEVNAHSLFSKWFSESGKLVNKLFGTILELVEDPDVSSPEMRTLNASERDYIPSSKLLLRICIDP